MKTTILLPLAAIAVLIVANCTDNAVSNAKDKQADDFARRFNPRPDTGNGGGTTTRTLTVNRNPTAGGTVTVNSTTTSGITTHNVNASVTVVATANSEYTFNGWTGAPSGVNASNPSITFNINTNLTLTANFTRQSVVTCSFTNPSTGQPYRTVTIGGREWMAENLNCATGNSWCYDGDSSNCNTYGRLYDWNTARSACPSGWRLPTHQEWQNLFTAVGGSLVAGTQLKSRPSDSPPWDGTNDFGFSALPGGCREVSGHFNALGNGGIWWGGTADYAYRVFMLTNQSDVFDNWGSENAGFSVRCVRE